MSTFTNHEQFEYLVEWMSKHTDIANGVYTEGRGSLKILLADLTEELNILGPPIKQAFQWRKVWTDFRSLVKRKLRQNFGDHHQFNHRELRVIEILQLENATIQELSNKKDSLKNKKIKKQKSIFKWDDSDEDSEMEDHTMEGIDNEGNRINNTINNSSNIDHTSMNDQNGSETTDYLTEFLKDQEIIENPKTETLDINEITKLLQQQLQIQKQQLQQQQAMVNVMENIEKQLYLLTETVLNSNYILEENNKLLKLLIYRNTKMESNDKKK